MSARPPTPCSPRSTPSSARSPPRCRARSACSPGPAPARPGRSRTASPTACTAASTCPQRVLAVTFTARAAGEMRTRLRELGAAGVQARTFHAAALRQLRYFWPRHVGGELPQLVEHKAGLVAEAAGRLRLATDRATRPRPRRPRSSGSRSRMTDRDDYAGGRREGRPGAAGRHRPGDGGPAARRRTSRSSATAASSTSRTCCSTPSACSPSTARSPTRCASSTTTSSSTSTRTSARCSRRCSTSGSAAATSSASSATRTRPSTPSPARRPTSCSASASGYPRRHGGAAGPRLPLHAAGRRAGQPAARRRPRRPARRRLELVAQRPARPATRPARARRRAGRGPAASRRRIAGAGRRPVRRPARSRCCSAPTARARPTSRRWPTPGCPTSLRGGRAVLRPAGGARGPAAAARRGPLGRRRRACRRRCAACCRGSGWSDAAAGRRRRGPRALGVAGRAGPARRRPGRGRAPGATLRDFVAELDERADAQHAPTVEGVTLASLHAAKGLEWDAVFVVGATDGMLPITYAETPEAGRGGAPAALRRGHPGPRAPVDHLVAGPRARAGAASRRPSRFLDGLHAVDRHGRAASRGARGRKGPGRPAGCAARRSTAPVARKLGRCEDCPSAYDEALFERLREWRGRAGAGGQRPGLRRVHRRDPHRARRGCGRPPSAELLAISGVGRTKLERYGADVLAICAGDPSPTASVRRRRFGKSRRQESKK